MAKPVKFIKAQITGISVAASATVNGVANVPFKWNATLAVVSQPHSDSTASPVANFYTGRNVAVGDWIVSSSEGKALQISTITAASDSSMTVVLEDVGNVNALSDETGNLDGMIPNGAGITSYIFEVIGNVPVLSAIPAALPGNLSFSFASNLISRFSRLYGGSSVVSSDIMTIGVLGETNKRIIANTNSGSKPELRYNTTNDLWEFSNDGTVFRSMFIPPTGDGYNYVPATGTTNNTKVLKAGATSGSAAWGTVSFAELSGKPTTLSGYGISDAAPSSHVGAGAAAHAVATQAANGFMSAADKAKLDAMLVPTFAFTVNFAGSNPSSVTGLPAGWTASISGTTVTVNHTVGLPLKGIFYWGVSTSGGVQRYRLPSASNEVTIPIAGVNSQFTATITTSVAGADVDASARVVVIF
jgi:hypothetical protein